jgi:hypothetical protein
MSESMERRRPSEMGESGAEEITVEQLQGVSGDIEFHRLLPGYVEYKNSPPVAEEPLDHGTGSHALEGILNDGFKPQQADQILHGEKVAHGETSTQVEPVSFAIGDRNGDKVSHLYAIWACNNIELNYNSDADLHNSRIERVLNDVYGGIDSTIERRVMKEVNARQVEYADDEHMTHDQKVKLAKDEMRKIIEHKFIDRSQSGANTFNPQRMKERYAQLEAVTDGDASLDDTEKVLRDTLLLEEARHYFTERDAPKAPLYKTGEVIDWAIGQIRDINSDLGKRTRDALQIQKRKVLAYEALPQEERHERENQFPCFIIVEGKGLKAQEVDYLERGQEVRSDNTVEAQRIREIQVPESKVTEVEQRVSNAGLSNIRVVPIEYFEMQEVIEYKKQIS